MAMRLRMVFYLLALGWIPTLALSAKGFEPPVLFAPCISPEGGDILGKFRFSVAGTTSDPEFAFGDGDTGWTETADDVIAWVFAGDESYTMDDDELTANTADGPSIQNRGARIGQPVFAFNGDTDTGVGADGTVIDTIGFDAGGVGPMIGREGTQAAGQIQWDHTRGACTFANLGGPDDGHRCYCSNCTFANPCAGGGTGAWAKRLNGAWRCD